MFGRCYALLWERSSLSSIIANGGDGSGGQSRCRSKRSVWKAGTWCRSICHLVSMLLRRPGMTRAQYLYQRTQQCASRCLAASPLLAQSGHHDRADPCPLLGVKRTLLNHTMRQRRYLALEVWPSRQARNAAAARWRSSALLNLRRGFFGGSANSGTLPLISSTPCRRIRLRLAICDQFIRAITYLL